MVIAVCSSFATIGAPNQAADRLGRRGRALPRSRHRDGGAFGHEPYPLARCGQDEGAIALLLLPVAAAIASLVAIFAELAAAKGAANYGWHAALAVTTIALSWTFIHTLFALHYAHDYYGEGNRANGLIFPGKDKPDYWDFAYFAFVVGMTFQVSDVQVSIRLIRRLVVMHGALSFVFNTAILAVTVNLATGAIGG